MIGANRDVPKGIPKVMVGAVVAGNVLRCQNIKEEKGLAQHKKMRKRLERRLVEILIFLFIRNK